MNRVLRKSTISSTRGEIMTVEEVLMEKVKVLPPNQKQEVLAFVENLEGKKSNDKETVIDSAIDEVFATRRELLARLAEGVK